MLGTMDLQLSKIVWIPGFTNDQKENHLKIKQSYELSTKPEESG